MILEHVNHPFLVGLAYAFQTSNKLYFIMQFMRKLCVIQEEESFSNTFPTLRDSVRNRPSFTQHRLHLDSGIYTPKILSIVI